MELRRWFWPTTIFVAVVLTAATEAATLRDLHQSGTLSNKQIVEQFIREGLRPGSGTPYKRDGSNKSSWPSQLSPVDIEIPYKRDTIADLDLLERLNDAGKR